MGLAFESLSDKLQNIFKNLRGKGRLTEEEDVYKRQGTENRKPMGYAYVAITFDNADHKLNIDYDEVTVSRRLFRSGAVSYTHLDVYKRQTVFLWKIIIHQY